MSYVATVPTNRYNHDYAENGNFEELTDIKFKLIRNYNTLRVSSALSNTVSDLFDIRTRKGKYMLAGCVGVAGVIAALSTLHLYAGAVDSIGGTTPLTHSLIATGFAASRILRDFSYVVLGGYGTVHLAKAIIKKKNKGQTKDQNKVLIDNNSDIGIDAMNKDAIVRLIDDLTSGKNDPTLTFASRIYNETNLTLNSQAVNARILQALAVHRTVIDRILNFRESASLANAALNNLSEELKNISEMEGCAEEFRKSDVVQSIIDIVPMDYTTYKPRRHN